MESLECKITSINNAFLGIKWVEFLTGSQFAALGSSLPSVNIRLEPRAGNTFSKPECSHSNKGSRSRLHQTKAVIHTWLVSYLSELLLVEPHEIDVQLPFEYYGMASLEVLRLTRALEDWLGRQLSLKLVYEYPTVEVLARYLAEEVDQG